MESKIGKLVEADWLLPEEEGGNEDVDVGKMVQSFIYADEWILEN